MTLPFDLGATTDPALPAPAPAPAPPPSAPAPPDRTDWTLIMFSGVAVSVVTTLFWLAIDHTHRAIKKTNKKLSKR